MAAKHAPAAPRATRPAPRAIPWLDAAIAALAIASLVLLWSNAATTILTTDECFHAWVARWIAAHGSLPRVIDGLYSGMPYFYPPLFHGIAAVAVKLAGGAALPYLNVVLTGALYALLLFVPVPGVPAVARRWAVVFMLANTSLALYGVRFYAEVLATLFAVAAVLLLLALRAAPRAALAAALGVATGLALLAKQPMVLLPALFVLLAVVDAVRGRRRLAGLLALAAAIGVLVALPFFVRNALLFGSPFYPPVASEAQRALDALNTRLFSPAPLSFYRSALEFAGPVLPWLVLGVGVWALARGPRDLRLGLVGLVVAFVLVAPWIARFEPRHLNPFIAVATVAALALLAERLRDRGVQVAITVLLIAWGGVALATRRDFRSFLNPPAVQTEAFAAVGTHVPPDETVLSLWTYDTFYHAERPSTWPIPWSPSAELLPLFTTSDPEVFLATLERHGVDWLLLPKSFSPREFSGANYPRGMLDPVLKLIDQGRLEIVWQTDAMGLVRRAR